MNLLKKTCDVCNSPLSLVYSEKHECYMAYKQCWNHIDPFNKESDELVRHDMHKDTPSLHRSTIIDQLPNENIREITKSILADLEPKNQSYVFHGTSGTGKTRASWLVVNHWFRGNYPRTVQFVSPRRLDSLLIGSFSDSIKAHEQAVDRMCNIPMLVIDDLGKERLTPRVESDIFAIVDERISHERPTIITTNYNGRSLLEKFPTKETGIALIRRLREHFRFVSSAEKEDAK